jgi:hypothetical protein
MAGYGRDRRSGIRRPKVVFRARPQVLSVAEVQVHHEGVAELMKVWGARSLAAS